jgi:hypothetical protein
LYIEDKKFKVMKTLITAVLTFFFPFLLLSQNGPSPDDTKKERPGNYILTGYRHGSNFFPSTKHAHVEYEAGETLSFNKFHSADVIYFWLNRWAEKYPELVDLYEVGTSFEGRPILQITITNKKTGKDTDKPAAFFEGGRHSGEVSGSECVMWLAKYLLENQGMDPEVTHLLDSRTIYLRPVNNPDGHNLYMNTAQSNRSTVRPDDNDGDGLLDEDPPEDINGDGMILTMRWKDEKKGTHIPDPEDPTGRIMKQVPAGKGIYLISSEGIDNDGDGRTNEDGIGGLDLHRNYPENWRPRTEMTGRGYTQGGAGEYPLSETETRAVIAFLLSHPNISVVNSMDTSVPMHLRPPSTSSSSERMYPEDLEWYKYFDAVGKKITGYERAGDVYDDYGGGSPLFGHGPDFGYWYYGSIWYGDEIWNNGRNKDYNGDGTIDQKEVLRWDDEENGGDGFIEWKAAKHPVYGEVEIGGFDPKFFSQNPPSKHMERWVKNEAMFNLEMIKSLPEISWENIEVRKLKSYKNDSADYQISVSFRNKGKLPTALKQAQLVKIVRNDRIVVDLTPVIASEEKQVFKILQEKSQVTSARNRGASGSASKTDQTRSVSKNVAFTQGGAVTKADFKIRTYDGAEVKGRAHVYSTRGGILREKEFIVK